MTFIVVPWNGQPISKPGIYSSIPMDAYHGQLTVGPSVSSSGLRKIFSESLAHYFVDSYLNPDNWEVVKGVLTRKEKKASEPFTIGRAGHHLLLGERDFREHFCIQPAAYPSDEGDKPWSNNATFCKRWHAQAKADRLTVLTSTQIEHIRGIAQSLQQHPLIKLGILNGKIEHSMVWLDEETGIWLKARPDAIPESDLDFGDLKIVESVSDDAIERSIGDYGYNQQAALVGEGCRVLLGREMNSFNLICAEKTPPYCSQIRAISKDAYLLNDASAPEPSDLELGEMQNRAALRLMAIALETGEWPGPGGDQSDARTVRMKPFARSKASYRLKQIDEELLASRPA